MVAVLFLHAWGHDDFFKIIAKPLLFGLRGRFLLVLNGCEDLLGCRGDPEFCFYQVAAQYSSLLRTYTSCAGKHRSAGWTIGYMYIELLQQTLVLRILRAGRRDLLE